MKAFKIKNGLSAKRYLGNSTTLSGSTIDLSLGSMFSATLSSDPAYTFTNPPASGNAQAFSVEVTGGTTAFNNDFFATTLYDGNNGSQTITNGVDLDGEGGLIWTKNRSATNNYIYAQDTEQGLNTYLATGTSAAGSLTSGLNFVASSTGYSMSNSFEGWNSSGDNYVSWTFRKAPKFFDVVTYSGNSVNGRAIPHDLGCEVGMLIVKPISSAGDWWVYHRKSNTSNPGTAGGKLHETVGWDDPTDRWNSTAPTSTHFYLEGGAEVNGSGKDYVAYLFAHDTASDSLIKCGNYTGNGSTTGPEIDLGWQPQWIMVKQTSSAGNWYLVDSVRGISSGGNDALLFANTNDPENVLNNRVYLTPTGFGIEGTTSGGFNDSGENFVYTAIRASESTDSAITWPSSVKWPSGIAPTTPAPGKKDLFTFLTTDGGTTYYGKKAAEGVS
jgi:hypothetical protein